MPLRKLLLLLRKPQLRESRVMMRAPSCLDRQLKRTKKSKKQLSVPSVKNAKDRSKLREKLKLLLPREQRMKLIDYSVRQTRRLLQLKRSERKTKRQKKTKKPPPKRNKRRLSELLLLPKLSFNLRWVQTQ